MEVVASLSQGRTAAAQCGIFTRKSVPVIFEPPCISEIRRNLSAFRKKELRSLYVFNVGLLLESTELRV